MRRIFAATGLLGLVLGLFLIAKPGGWDADTSVAQRIGPTATPSARFGRAAVPVLQPTSPPREYPVPRPPPGVAPPSPPPANDILGQEPVQRLLRESYARATPVSLAESTRGKALTIDGKHVQLPPDAYVESLVARVLCVVGEPCPETPAYVIARGESRIYIGVRTGQIIEERIAPGAGQPFESIKDGLR